MNEASRWRLELGRAISGRYALNPRVAVVEIGGSVARGHADRYSDLELGVCWSEAPGLEERLDVIERLGGVLGTVYPRDGDAGEWAEDYAVHDVKIDVSHHTVESLERRLDDVVVRCDPDLARQELASAIRHAIPLHGEEHLRRWQAGIERYPDGLARAMVREHLRFKPHWAGEMLAERDDFLVVHGAITGFEQELLLVLMGLNRLYFPGFKWIHRLRRRAVDRAGRSGPATQTGAVPGAPRRRRRPARSDPGHPRPGGRAPARGEHERGSRSHRAPPGVIRPGSGRGLRSVRLMFL